MRLGEFNSHQGIPKKKVVGTNIFEGSTLIFLIQKLKNAYDKNKI